MKETVTPLEDDVHNWRGFQGQQLYPFQETCIRFAREANGRVLLNLDVGAGKTPISLACTKLLAGQTHPVLIITKAKLKVQWMKQIYKWLGEFSYILDKVDTPLLPVKYYIMSYEVTRKWADSLVLRQLGIRTLILDECQHIRNIDSKRSVSVKKIAAKVEKVIGLSAHPIKNRFSEYYPTLHCIQPTRFPSFAQFARDWCYSSSNKYGIAVGGCRDIEAFFNETRDFIIRFTKEEVLPDLPKVQRDFQYYDLSAEVEEAYFRLEEELSDYMENTEDKGSAKTSHILAFLVKMRHLTGLSKVEPTVEEASEFILSCDRKLTIFVHHQLVAEMIIASLNGYLRDGGFPECLHLKGGMSDEDLANLLNDFEHGPYRVMVASTLASGEGLDLQFCSDAIFVERQWNSVNEEQAEGRFERIGQKANKILVKYMIALGTIDEWLTELVEEKRKIVHSTLTGVEVEDESNVINQLAEMIVQKRNGRKWNLRKKFYGK